jgi:hypothetical protein
MVTTRPTRLSFSTTIPSMLRIAFTLGWCWAPASREYGGGRRPDASDASLPIWDDIRYSWTAPDRGQDRARSTLLNPTRLQICADLRSLKGHEGPDRVRMFFRLYDERPSN